MSNDTTSTEDQAPRTERLREDVGLEAQKFAQKLVANEDKARQAGFEHLEAQRQEELRSESFSVIMHPLPGGRFLAKTVELLPHGVGQIYARAPSAQGAKNELHMVYAKELFHKKWATDFRACLDKALNATFTVIETMPLGE